MQLHSNSNTNSFFFGLREESFLYTVLYPEIFTLFTMVMHVCIVHTLWSCMHAAHHASGSLFEIWICDPCILKYTYNYDACYHCHVFWICVSQNLLYNYYIYSTVGDVSIRSDDKCVMIERYSFHQQCIRAHPLIEGQYSRRSQGWPIRLSQVKHVCPP